MIIMMRTQTHTFAEINLHDVVSEMLHSPAGFEEMRLLRRLLSNYC